MHPPIGVHGDVAHGQGAVMLSYRYQRQSFAGLQVGEQELFGPAAGYAESPTALRQDAHWLELYWAPVHEVTFVLTLPYLDKEMDQLVAATGLPYTSQAKGFGDFTMTLLYRVYDARHSRLHLNFGLSLPSGSTNESQVTPASGGVLQRLPYAMQLGSGTVDLRPGVTLNAHAADFYFGGQLGGVLHAGTNTRGYRLGNSYHVTGWAGWRVAPWLGTSFRLDWRHVFDPDGADPLLVPTRSPAEDARLLGGMRLDALFGADVFFDGAGLEGTRLSIEAGLPAYQSLDGPQLAADWLLTAALQYAF